MMNERKSIWKLTCYFEKTVLVTMEICERCPLSASIDNRVKATKKNCKWKQMHLLFSSLYQFLSKKKYPLNCQCKILSKNKILSQLWVDGSYFWDVKSIKRCQDNFEVQIHDLKILSKNYNALNQYSDARFDYVSKTLRSFYILSCNYEKVSQFYEVWEAKSYFS